MENWKWYAREEDNSFFYSPEVPPRAIEVPAPPKPRGYLWDFKDKKWVFDIKEAKHLARVYAEEEFARLKKFQFFDKYAIDLNHYIQNLVEYVATQSESSTKPSVPTTLTDDYFYNDDTFVSGFKTV